METINSFMKARKAKNISAMIDLVADDVIFVTPRWEARGKSALKKQLKERQADEPEFFDESPWEELKAGRKYTKTMKIKILLLLTFKVRQTFSVKDGKIRKMIAKKI